MRHVASITLTLSAVALWGVLWMEAQTPAVGNVPERTEASLGGFALSSPVKVEAVHRAQPTHAAEAPSQAKSPADVPEVSAPVIPAVPVEEAVCLEWGPVGMADLQRARPALQAIGWIDRMRMLSVPEHYAAWSGPYKDEAAAVKAAAAMVKRGCEASPVFVKPEGWGVRLGTFHTAADASAWLLDAAPRCRISSPAVRHERPEDDAVRLVFQPLTPEENAQLRQALETLGRPYVCPQVD